MEEEVKKEAEAVQEGVQEKEKEELGKSLDKMTAKELREIAIEIPGVAGVHAMKKEELLKIIKEAKGIKDEGRKRSIKAQKTDVNVGELKKKIRLLKDEKTKARTEKDRKKVEILRRRINRIKKKTRKIPRA